MRAVTSESQALRGRQESLERQLEAEAKAPAGVRAANARTRTALDTVTWSRSSANRWMPP